MCTFFVFVFMKNDYKYMNLTIKEAKKTIKFCEVPIGAVIVINDKIIAKGYNMKEKKHCSLKHAELVAIEKACGKIKNWRLNNATIYVTLEPCPMCASAIKQSRIERVVYLLENKNKKNSKIVDDIFNVVDSNKPVEKYKLDLNKFKNDDIMMLSDFFYKKRK